MRFLKRDLTKFSLYKPTPTEDDDGDIRNVYDTPAIATFDGNIQPCSERSLREEYGIAPQYACFIYVPVGTEFKELDRVTDGALWYEIKVIQRWRTYLRLLVERVEPNG
ncbi:MAG: hypothetical protein LBU77_01905 [Clostridiales bacterium]|jgi:hypothetical protein|nr:hypothetical protein [Clostridiales bacterium]